jgi:ATP-dependent phosphoenolpyruvate carboxykinase
VLAPADSWADKEGYMRRYKELAARYIENFKKYEEACPPEIRKAGPKL